MIRTPGLVAALVSAIVVVGCSTQSSPTAPSRSLGTPNENLAPGLDRTTASLPDIRLAHAPDPCAPTMLAPNLSTATAAPSSLWPPNHKWNDVLVSYTATSPCHEPQPIACSLSVGSNEPVNGRGDGNTSSDWQVVNANLVRLRAERSGLGTGRIYTITVTCTHTTGGPSATSTTSVLVPHDRGKK